MKRSVKVILGSRGDKGGELVRIDIPVKYAGFVEWDTGGRPRRNFVTIHVNKMKSRLRRGIVQ